MLLALNETMEAVGLLTFILAVIVFLASMYYGQSRSSTDRARQPTVKVRDPAVARRALIDQADAFSNRPATPFPVPLITGPRRRHSHGITTVPYGPHWRALRSNLTAAILQPWRQGLLAPLQLDAVDALVAGLLTRRPGDDVVVVRDGLYAAVFVMLARVCFGNGVDARRVRAMERMMQEFRVAIGEAKVFARSTAAKLKHWRQWRRFLAFRSRQASLFAPLIADARRRQSSGGGGGGGVRPYVDSLIDLRVPDENDARQRRALTDDEMVSLVVEFLGAVESIVAVVEWTLAHLVARPEVQRKLRHEVNAVAGSAASDKQRTSSGSAATATYLHAVVLESLRLHPPFPLIMRELRSGGGEVIGMGTGGVPAAGVRVQFMLAEIGKDKDMWTDPGEFRPERFLPGGEGEGVALVPAGGKEIRMMPFGAGQRSCPGAALGMQYIKGFLAPLVSRFEWAALTAEGGGDGGVDMTELYGFITVMKTPLRARMRPCA